LVGGVAADRREFRMQRRLATGQDDAVVAAGDEIIDQYLHGFEGVDVRRRGIGTEAAEVVAVANHLDVADVCHESG